ncbi:putative dnase1 protein [Botrytis fragariae]|uniref:Putative dnase1 protein n=1 Tax=Botrytis fragariae TaxID=1964551 RepID=A0A8H6B2K1_9HELO|nr:putative dnase1 protein [Botrytis fragariae]KAF5877872.1 putative dnase1 protein [Botrytis fragariae]
MSRLHNLTILVISIFSFLVPVMGNTLQFLSQDTKERTVFFTPNAGSAEVPSFFVPASSVDGNAVVHFPQGWSGSFKAVLSGESPDVPKVTGEITFQGWQGETYYTVSAVQNCCDNSGIRSLASQFTSPISGCIEAPFPCTASYSRPGDIQVKSSPDIDFMCILGEF